MAASSAAMAVYDERSEHRDDVHHRARGTGPAGQPLTLLIVNMSGSGLMARCETPLAAGDRLKVVLPVIGQVQAEVRWALGGRLGCQLDRTIPLASYYTMLAAMMRR